VTKVVCTSCGEVHKGPFQQRDFTDADRNCPCGGRRVLPSQAKSRKGLKQKSDRRQAEEESGARPKQRRAPIKRSEPKRDWTDGRAKVEEEGCCRICKRSDRPLEAAHVLGREHDEPKTGADGWPLKELYVDPDRIVPACGPFPAGCHGDVDMRRINLLQHLSLPEQIKAVEDAGGIEAARIRLAPVENREEIEQSAVAA
jgi:hypothetical protein